MPLDFCRTRSATKRPSDDALRRGVDMGGSLKEKRTQSNDNTAVKKMVETIAGRHSIEPVVSKNFAAITVPHRGQTNVGDMHFLTEWAKKLRAIFKVAEKKLLFVEKGTGKSGSGGALPVQKPVAT